MEVMGLNLAVVGIGRLGLCFALNLEKAGYNVIGYDIRDDHIYEVNKKLFRSTEPGLNDLVKNYNEFYDKFRATSSLTETVSESDVIFVTLRTESDIDGKYNHDQIESFLEQLELLGKQDKPKHLVICSNSHFRCTTNECSVVSRKTWSTITIPMFKILIAYSIVRSNCT